MVRTLYAKLSLVLILLLVAVGLVYVLLSLSSARHYLQEVDQNLGRDLAKNLVADKKLVEAGRINQNALKKTFMDYMVINPSIEIYLLDLQGGILSYSAEPGKVKRNTVSLGPIRAFLDGKVPYPILGDDPRSHDGRKVFSATPVPSMESPQGYLYVVLRGERYDTVESFIKDSYAWRLSGWALGSALLIGLLAGLLLFHVLTRRLNRLAQVMDDFRQSGFTHRVPQPPEAGQHDEIGRLSQAFNQMAQRMAEQLETLKNLDISRRELVANVSHDLRTPMAILHGYLETLKLKRDELNDDERDRYLTAALRNSERLSHLVSELFELAKLEAPETTPAREAFHPAELAQDILQKFQIKADQQDVHLHLDAEKNLPFVSADIGLIARTLENLISNALRFTPAGGHVYLKVLPLDDSVKIQVKDTGCGIAKEDIPHIFDRFFQGSRQQRSSEHGGLGLAIVKRILELHDENIHVDSALGQGTVFTFSLPREHAA
jgi:signal transduction histidine kinase